MKKPEKKKIQGFNGIRTHDLRVTGALLYQLSYEAIHWERGQFIEFIAELLARAKRAQSGAPWVRKFGKLSIWENLVMT